MTIFVTWQLIVTPDSIRNSCNVYFIFSTERCSLSQSHSNPLIAPQCDIHLRFLSPFLLAQNGLSSPWVWQRWQRGWPLDSSSYCQRPNVSRDTPPSKRHGKKWLPPGLDTVRMGCYLFFWQLNVKEVTDLMYCRLLIFLHLLKPDQQFNCSLNVLANNKLL